MSKMKRYCVIVSCEGEDEGRYKQESKTYTIDACCKDDAENEALDMFHADFPFDGDYNTVAIVQYMHAATRVDAMHKKAESYRKQFEELKESARVGSNGIALSPDEAEKHAVKKIKEVAPGIRLEAKVQ